MFFFDPNGGQPERVDTPRREGVIYLACSSLRPLLVFICPTGEIYFREEVGWRSTVSTVVFAGSVGAGHGGNGSGACAFGISYGACELFRGLQLSALIRCTNLYQDMQHLSKLPMAIERVPCDEPLAR